MASRGATTGLAVWRRMSAALLIGLVALAAGLCPPPAEAAHDSPLGYSVADDHDAEAAFKAHPGALPGLPGAFFFHFPCDLRDQFAPGPVPGRAPLPTRDRSPPRS